MDLSTYKQQQKYSDQKKKERKKKPRVLIVITSRAKGNGRTEQMKYWILP